MLQWLSKQLKEWDELGYTVTPEAMRILRNFDVALSAESPRSEPPTNSAKDSPKPCCESRKVENDTTPVGRPTC